MADLTVSSVADFDLNSVNYVIHARAGADLTPGMPVYMASDGTVKPCISTQCTIATLPDFLGVSGETVKSGKMVTVYGKNTRFTIMDSGLTPGALFYISATGGKISDAKIAVLDVPFALAVSATDLLVIK
jgi:hypothetical protein